MKRARIAVLFGLLLVACRTPITGLPPPDMEQRLGDVDPLRVEQYTREVPTRLAEDRKDDPAVEVPVSVSSLDLAVGRVRELALVNNLGLRVQRFEPDIARQTYDEERAKFDAIFRTAIRAAREDLPARVPGTVTGLRGLVVEPGVTLPLRTGGAVSLGLPITYDETKIQDYPDESYHATVLNFSYSQPLLRNAGCAVNTASIRVARLQTKKEEAKTKLFAIRVLANAERAYWGLYAAEAEVTIRREQYERALTQRTRAVRMVAEGAMPKVEIARADSGVARSLEAIVIAETTRKRHERELKLILNLDDMPVDSATVIHVATEPTPLGLDLDRGMLLHHAVRNRMEMLALELQVAIDETTLQVQRNQALPNLALEFNYSFRGRSSSSLFSAIDRLRADNLADVRLVLNFDQPIGNRAAKARLRQSLLARGRTMADQKRQEQEIHQEVLDAVDQLEQNWQRVLATRQDVFYSGKTYEGEKRQFQLGTRTTTEVLEALDFLADAQSREVRALAAYQNALVELAYATGTVLGLSNVAW